MTAIGFPVSPFVLIKGAGEMASAIACRLRMANIQRICMIDLPHPLAVRRGVSFSTVLENKDTTGPGSFSIEEVEATAAINWEEIQSIWSQQKIAVVRTCDWENVEAANPDIIIDAILAKKNLGTNINQAPLVIALGPGFVAGKDSHLVIETNRGHNLGKIITRGAPEANTGIPGNIGGFTNQRVLKAPLAGKFEALHKIGDSVKINQVVGTVSGVSIPAKLNGVIRGLIQTGTDVPSGFKVGDIDPRGKQEYCYSISDKARTISGSVLECTMGHFNRF